MKKLFCLLLSSLFISTSVFATPQFSYEWLPKDSEPLLGKVDILPDYLQEYRNDYYLKLNGKTYIVGLGVAKYTFPQRVDNINDNVAFSAYDKAEEYIWTGSYYMARSYAMDVVGGYAYNVKPIPIRFYDADYHLVSEYAFEYSVSAINYYNNTYYCKLFVNGKVMKSTDMINWQETVEDMPRTIGETTFAENKVALNDNGMAQISYENSKPLELYSSLGDWILKKDGDNNYYISNDNVYFVKIEYPTGQKEYDIAHNLKYEFKCIYEYNDDIIIDLRRENRGLAWGNTKEELTEMEEQLQQEVGKILRLTVPKAEIYAELERQKSAPYIMLNDAILGFEQAPVVEQDRTLVPMRFLFEQMGADVDWDESTETATVTKDGEQISFQIDSPAAKVGSEVKLMDVPAKLVSDKTMVPLRFLSENLGYNVQWDEATKMVTITTE